MVRQAETRDDEETRGIASAAVEDPSRFGLLAMALATVALVLTLTVWRTDPVVVIGTTTASPALAENPAAATDEPDPPVERVVEGPNVALLPPSPALPLLVGDPRPGDLRTDPEADTLPASYTPAPAAIVERDIAYGPATVQRLDLHLPAPSADGPPPVLLYLHSGGWIGGAKEGVPDLVMRFVERGYAVASVDYHLAPEHPFPAAVTDVKLAIRWLKSRAESTGIIDGDRMLLVGASAGGHLAAFAPTTAGAYEPADLSATLADQDTSVAGVVSLVGPTDLVQLYDQPHEWARGITTAFAGCFPCSTAELREPSVAPHLHADLPPAYWIYGEQDPLVDADHQGVAIAEAWAQHAGAYSSWLDIVDGAGHDLDESQVNMRALEAFVDAAVGQG